MKYDNQLTAKERGIIKAVDQEILGMPFEEHALNNKIKMLIAGGVLVLAIAVNFLLDQM